MAAHTELKFIVKLEFIVFKFVALELNELTSSRTHEIASREIFVYSQQPPCSRVNDPRK
jgi:hypothetical protein